jgi:hypothetical protein
MIYQAYQTHTDLWAPVRAVADWTHALFRETYAGPLANPYFRNIAAGAELLARTKLIHDRPAFGIGTVSIAGENVPVHEDVEFATPFGALLHFRKARVVNQPRVLVVAPMAGHFATLLRDTVRTLLPEHDVYVTDWFNARDVAHSHGRFGLDEYIAHLVAFLEHLGPRTHVIGVCQPCAALLASVALLNEDDNPAAPPSMTLMAGPIDTRINPTRVNEFATGHDIAWFERNVIDVVPLRHEGARRRVYPGFMQLIAFLSMNLPRAGDARLLRRVFFRAGPARRILSRDRRARVPGASPAARTICVAQPDSRYARDPQDGALHGGRRARRRVRAGTNARRAGPLLRPETAETETSPAVRRRPLWSLRRPQVAQRDLSASARFHLAERVKPSIVVSACAGIVIGRVSEFDTTVSRILALALHHGAGREQVGDATC